MAPLLRQGICPICSAEIDKEWGGEMPALGMICRSCYPDKKVTDVFSLNDIIFPRSAFKHLATRLIGLGQYLWNNTRVKVNGEHCVVKVALGTWTMLETPAGRYINIAISWHDLRDFWQQKIDKAANG